MVRFIGVITEIFMLCRRVAVLVGLLWHMMSSSAFAISLPDDVVQSAKMGQPAALMAVQRAWLGEGAEIKNAEVDTADVQRALDILNQAAEHESVIAFRMLGDIYAKGVSGIVKNPSKAFDYYVLAARKRDAQGQLALAAAYYKGFGTDVNLISAYVWAALSVRHEKIAQTPYQHEMAVQLMQSVKKALTEVQIAKAEELIVQIDTLYLPK